MVGCVAWGDDVLSKELETWRLCAVEVVNGRPTQSNWILSAR